MFDVVRFLPLIHRVAKDGFFLYGVWIFEFSNRFGCVNVHLWFPFLDIDYNLNEIIMSSSMIIKVLTLFL